MENFFISLAINIAIMLLTPKPKLQGAKRYDLSEFDIPTATEDRAWSYGAGTFKLAGNVVWSGDYFAEEVVKKVRVNALKTTGQTIGWRYHIGFWMTLCALPCDRLREVRLGDKVVWSGALTLSKTSVTTLEIDAEWTTSEGQEVTDGMCGRLHFFNHKVAEGEDYMRLPNPYMETQLDRDTVPAYPNTLHVVWEGPSGAPVGDDGKRPGFIATGPSVAPIQFVLERAPDLSFLSGLEGVEVPAPYLDSYGDADVGHVLLELMCSRAEGLGPRIPAHAVNVASLLNGNYDPDTHVGTSFAKEVTTVCGEVVQQLCDFAAVSLDCDEQTGRVTGRAMGEALFGLPGASFELTDSQIIRIESRTTDDIRELPNRIAVPFIDRSRNWAERIGYANNTGSQRAAGRVIERQSEYVGVSSHRVATYLARRTARNLGAARQRYRVISNMTGASTGVYPHVGSRIGFIDPVNDQHVEGICSSSRVASFNNSPQLEIECWAGDWSAGISAGADADYVEGPGSGLPAPGVVGWQFFGILAPQPLSPDPSQPLMLYLAGAPYPPERAAGYRLAFFDNESTRNSSTAVWMERSMARFAARVSVATAVAFTATSSTVSASTSVMDAYTLSKNSGETVALFVDGSGEIELMKVLATKVDDYTASVSILERGLYGTRPMTIFGDLYLLYDWVVDAVPLVEDSSGQVTQPSYVRAQTMGPGGRGPFNSIDPSSDPFVEAGTYPGKQAAQPFAPARMVANGGLHGKPWQSFFPPSSSALGLASVPATGLVTFEWSYRDRTKAVTAPQGYFSGWLGAEVGQTVTAKLQYYQASTWTDITPTGSNLSAGWLTADLSSITGEKFVRLQVTIESPSAGNSKSFSFVWLKPA